LTKVSGDKEALRITINEPDAPDAMNLMRDPKQDIVLFNFLNNLANLLDCVVFFNISKYSRLAISEGSSDYLHNEIEKGLRRSCFKT
jgi:hypothetical protein